MDALLIVEGQYSLRDSIPYFMPSMIKILFDFVQKLSHSAYYDAYMDLTCKGSNDKKCKKMFSTVSFIYFP